jgi:hypothetical protein
LIGKKTVIIGQLYLDLNKLENADFKYKKMTGRNKKASLCLLRKGRILSPFGGGRRKAERVCHKQINHIKNTKLEL